MTYQTPDVHIDEVFSGASADEVVSAMQRAVAARGSLAVRLFVGALSPLSFAQVAVDRYNDAAQRSIARPTSCEEFLRSSEREGLLTVLDP
ncbi:MAG TPA: hypothetical protein VLH79_02095 [Chthonomonadales bacterium]|nr:hypothetical protein [Chthonomonadales bacterium]